jgi:twitching motility protein PilT
VSGVSAIDELLKTMAETSARGLRLAVGTRPRFLDQYGAPVDASSSPLTRQELLQLIGPIIPEHARRRVPQEASVEFDHASPDGAFKVTIMRNGSEIGVSIVPDRSAPAASAAPAVSTAAVEPPRVVVDNPDAPAIDRLFHLMVEAKASDLHLSSGMPALVRKDGRLQPLEADAPPITPAQMVSLLHPITPDVNRQEFAERNDTDFAYEIRGLARFRANMFLDRKGQGAVFRVIPAKILSAEDLGLSPHIL